MKARRDHSATTGVFAGIVAFLALAVLGYSAWNFVKQRSAQSCRACARPVHSHMKTVAMVQDGTFREDLYYRLAVVPLVLPPGGISLEAVEKELIERALDKCNSNQTRAAEHLGISRKVLIYRMVEHGLRQDG